MSAINSVITAMGGWVANVIDTAILTVMCYPGKVAASIAAIALVGGASYAVFRVGRNKGKW